MDLQVNQKITWEIVVHRYCAFKVLRLQSVRNYTHFIKIFSRYFDDDFNEINAITPSKVAMFRSFF